MYLHMYVCMPLLFSLSFPASDGGGNRWRDWTLRGSRSVHIYRADPLCILIMSPLDYLLFPTAMPRQVVVPHAAGYVCALLPSFFFFGIGFGSGTGVDVLYPYMASGSAHATAVAERVCM